jgi:hypothetical protein
MASSISKLQSKPEEPFRSSMIQPSTEDKSLLSSPERRLREERHLGLLVKTNVTIVTDQATGLVSAEDLLQEDQETQGLDLLIHMIKEIMTEEIETMIGEMTEEKGSTIEGTIEETIEGTIGEMTEGIGTMTDHQEIMIETMIEGIEDMRGEMIEEMIDQEIPKEVTKEKKESQ